METADEKVEDIHAEMERCIKSLGRRNKYAPRLGTYEFMHIGDRFKSAHKREMKERDERIDRALRVLREAVGGIKPPVDADSSEVYQDARHEDGKFVAALRVRGLVRRNRQGAVDSFGRRSKGDAATA